MDLRSDVFVTDKAGRMPRRRRPSVRLHCLNIRQHTMVVQGVSVLTRGIQLKQLRCSNDVGSSTTSISSGSRLPFVTELQIFVGSHSLIDVYAIIRH
jgi:hypothetical protein